MIEPGLRPFCSMLVDGMPSFFGGGVFFDKPSLFEIMSEQYLGKEEALAPYRSRMGKHGCSPCLREIN